MRRKQGDLLAGQHVGQRFVALDVDLLPDVPVESEVVAVEGAQGADGLVERAGFELALVLEVDEEVEHLPAPREGDGSALGSGRRVGGPSRSRFWRVRSARPLSWTKRVKS